MEYQDSRKTPPTRRIFWRKRAGGPTGWALWICLQRFRKTLAKCREVGNFQRAPIFGVRARFRRNSRRPGEFFDISVLGERGPDTRQDAPCGFVFMILAVSRKVGKAHAVPICGVRARYWRNARRFGEFVEISVFWRKMTERPTGLAMWI